MAEIEKLDLKSMDIVEEKREQLKSLFPEAFTEGQKIDFDRLKLTLGEMVDPGKERYGMNWPGGRLLQDHPAAEYRRPDARPR